jgi:serpin B
MTNRPVLCGMVILLTACGCGKDAKQPAPPGTSASKPVSADLAAVAKSNNQFAVDLYAKLAANEKDGNLFFSPFSISTTLTMTCGGARGKTAEEMRKILHFALADDKLHPAAGALLDDLNAAGKAGGFELSVANALWAEKSRQFLPEFLALNKANYHAGLETLDFAGDAEGARKTINAWVERQTQDRIKDLIQPGSFDQLTRLVLTNAVYFKAGWESIFIEGMTLERPFKLFGGGTIKTPIMAQTNWFPFGAGGGFKAVELPYEGKRLAMLILLPDKDDGLPALEKKLSVKLLEGLKLENHEVALSLPRFTLATECRLDSALKSLGMVAAFDAQKADLSGLDGETAPGKRLFLAAAVHKAFVEVNEKGTEAAGATGGWLLAAGEEPKPFIADHPFLFLIRDRETGCILFIGRVTNPAPALKK